MLDPNFPQDVLEFHRQAGATIGERPHIPDGELDFPVVIMRLHSALEVLNRAAPESRLSRRMAFIVEELVETIEAARDGDLVEFFDGILDLLYVVVGLGITSGLPLNAGWEIVHAANLAKVGGERLEDEKGKIQKPAGWIPPQEKLTALLIRMGCNPESPDGEPFDRAVDAELLPAEDECGQGASPVMVVDPEDRDEEAPVGGLLGRW